MKQMIGIILLLAGSGTAGVYRDAGSGLYPFLKMDVGARAAALGGTGAVNGGVLSIFTNPALIASEGPSMSAGHNQWYGETTQNYLAAVAGIGGSFTGSLALRSVSTMNLEYRETPSSDPIDTFNAYDFSFNGAVAASFGNFDAGIGLKVIHEKIWLESSNGWAADIGICYNPAPGLILTGAYLHSGPAVTMADTEFRFPRTWVFASRWTLGVPLGTAAVSAQVMRPLDNRTRAGFGLEYCPVQWAALRGGWKLNDESSSLSAGAGLSSSGWGLDYAFVPGDYSLGTSHRFTLSRSL